MKKVGLLGGSFDLPHRGHIYISEEAKKILELDQIWWLVTPQNPLKIKKPATYEERIFNCRNIVKSYPISIKEIEKKINAKYTFYTIKYLRNHYPHIKFYWLMGADNLVNFHHWQKWKQIFYKVSIVVFRRYGYNNSALKSIAKKTFSNFQINVSQFKNEQYISLPSWAWVNNREIKISSTEIRKQRKLLRG